MKMRTILLLLLLPLSNAIAHQVPNPNVGPALNKDGSIVTGILTASFDPSNGVLPFPHNLLFTGTTDLTLNVPVADPSNFGDPSVALSAMDGFSTIEKWVVSFVDADGAPGAIDPATVIPGHSVRVFQVNTAQIVAVTGIVKEMVAGVDYVATVANGNIVAIIWLKPLQELSGYMAVLTNDIKDMNGNDATPDTTYFLSKRDSSWVDAGGNSTYPLIDNETAIALEGLRQITLTMEAAAESVGIDHNDIILSYTVQTQSITPTLKLLRSTAAPAPTTIVPTGASTAAFGGAGIADVMIGIITLPYYLGIPSIENPTAPITDFWTAAPGAYFPPADQFGLDPTSTHVTAANPFPVLTGLQTVPVIMTVPNAASGFTKPDAGWPVVIYGHGLGSNRVSVLAMADTVASIGYAIIAIDFPLHGVVPDPTSPLSVAFNIENTPFGPAANERTFDVDFISNTTGAPGPDGMVDPSGTHALNFASLLTSRDNVRQGIADLSVLAVTIPTIDINGDGFSDLDGSNVAYAALSWGSIHGTSFTAIEPIVTRAFLSVPAGGLFRAGEASPTFQGRIRAGLAAAGIFPGTAEYEAYFTVGQTVVDSADPINWSLEAAALKPVLLHEVIGDTVLPNFVPTAPLSGTEPMIAVMGLKSYSTSQADPGGLRVAARFVPPAQHASLLSPTASLAATVEMQTQMASFIVSKGTFVGVGDASTMVPVLNIAEMILEQPVRSPGTGKKGRGSGGPALGPSRLTAMPRRNREGMNNE